MSQNSIIVYATEHRRYFSSVFILFAIFFLGFYSGDSIPKGFSASVSPTPTPNAANDLFNVELDRDTFSRSCPTGYRCTGNCNGEPLVISVVSKTNLENNALRYVYTARYGRVIGEGAKVHWNLKGAQPGTYEIKIDVTDEKSGNTLQSTTKVVTVLECNDGGDRCLECPQFSVTAPTAPVQAGETIDFAANGRGGTWSTFEYNWKVSDGKIIEGQGTPYIKVATTPNMAGKTIEATVKFEWECSDICEDNTVSAKVLVTAKKREGK